MVNAILLIVFFFLALYTLHGCYQIHRTERYRFDARYLLGWSASAIALHFSQVQIEILVRATYIKILIREREHLPQNFAIEMLEGRDVEPIIRHSTEWWDGSGEPNGLVGDSIPIESRVLAIIETFTDALAATDDPQAAMEKVKTEAGTQLDARLVDQLERVISDAD